MLAKALRVAALLLVLLPFGALTMGSAQAAAHLGIVLLHGKAGTPNQFDKLAAALRAAGFAVATPEMCWSKQRIFDKALPDCLKEVDAVVADLKAKGATSVVVGGASQGAVAAIDYGVTRSGLAGVIAMAPAADPPDARKFPDFAASMKAAQAAMKGRQGQAAASFADLVNGEAVTVNATAMNFLSFHGSDSPIATIRVIKAKLLPKLVTPLLWVAGSNDPTQASARAVFGAAPEGKLSSFVRIEADHAGTPDASADTIIAWLATLS